jgi:hypothetical protein
MAASGWTGFTLTARNRALRLDHFERAQDCRIV